MPNLTISSIINAAPSVVFDLYLDPESNQYWQNAGGGWTTGVVTIDPRTGGRFETEYKNPDGINDFVLGGVYNEIIVDKKILATIDDGRPLNVIFELVAENQTLMTLEFGMESENSEHQQRETWSAIIQSFKHCVERVTNPNNELLYKSITITASKDKVWNTLVDNDNYSEWTAPFMAGSYCEGEIVYGNTVHFMSPDGTGLVSYVRVCIPGFQVSFEQVGQFRNGIEDLDSVEVVEWKGARETYTMTQEDSAHGPITRLVITQDITKKDVEFFDESWDQALHIIKTIAEK